MADPGTGRGWVRSTGLLMPVVAGVALLVLGIVGGRVQVAGLGLPLLLGVAWCWQTRPSGAGEVSLSAPTQTDQDGRIRAVLTWRPADGAEQLRLNVAARGHRPQVVAVGRRAPRGSAEDPQDERELTLAMGSVRTGRRPVFLVTYAETAGQQVVAQPPATAGPVSITVLPRARSLRELPLPPRLQGLTGPHGSSRPGDGGDLRDVNLLVPGDRLRRIDWRVTARHAGRVSTAVPGGITELYVRRTFATADATVMLVLDSRDEVGPDVATWGQANEVGEAEQSSLDRARNAAATFARCYLESGDRVGLEDLGRLRRPVPPAAGRRQLQRLVERIALSEPEGEPGRRRRVPRLPSGALIVVFSTFLDDEAGWLAMSWRRSGHRVLAVDVLPPLVLDRLDDRSRLAYRMVDMERSDRLDDLTRSGIELVRWTERVSPTAGGSSTAADSSELPVEVALTALARRRARR